MEQGLTKTLLILFSFLVIIDVNHGTHFTSQKTQYWALEQGV